MTAPELISALTVALVKKDLITHEEIQQSLKDIRMEYFKGIKLEPAGAGDAKADGGDEPGVSNEPCDSPDKAVEADGLRGASNASSSDRPPSIGSG